jgi:hypothetical protein
MWVFENKAVGKSLCMLWRNIINKELSSLYHVIEAKSNNYCFNTKKLEEEEIGN